MVRASSSLRTGVWAAFLITAHWPDLSFSCIAVGKDKEDGAARHRQAKSKIEEVARSIENQANIQELPFPPKIISEITQADVDYLQREFRIRAIATLPFGHSIIGIYCGINNIFIRDAIRRGSEVNTQNYRDVLQKLVRNGVPQAPLFLIVADAYLSEQYKRRHLNRPNSQPSDDLDFSAELFRMDSIDPDFLNRTEEHAKKLKRSATNLKKAVDALMAEVDRERPEYLPEIGYAFQTFPPSQTLSPGSRSTISKAS